MRLFHFSKVMSQPLFYKVRRKKMNRNLSKVIELDEEEIRMLSNLLIRFTYKYPEKKRK